MRRFLALILALAMTLSAVMPSVALAYDSADTSGSSSITEQSSEASSEEASASKSSASEPEPEPEQPAPEAEPEDEPEQPAPEAEPEAEPEQSGDAESEPESSKDGSLYADTSESAPEEAPVLRQHTLRSTLKTVDGVRYQVTVAYDDTAEIPKGTSLSIVELNQELSEQEQKLPENQKRPYKTEEFVTEKALEQESFDLLQGLDVRDKDLVLFTKFLDLELKKDGRTIQPKSAVTVTVETDVVEEGASDALEVALYNAQATRDWQKERKKLEEEQQKKIKSGKLKEEDAKRFPEKVYTTMLLTNETQKKKGVKLSFEAEELARMGVCAVGGEMKTWKHKGEQVSVFGPRRLKAEVKSAGMNTPKDGLKKMGGFSVELKEKKKPDYDVTFWVGRRPNASAVETQADDGEDAGVAAYSLKDGKTKKELLTPEDDAPAAIEAGDKIGLVWDTGLRDRTLEAEQVTLSGLLPKRAHVETNDMLWRYSRPEALSEDVQQGDAATLAAYDISIENRGAEYQPEADNPVTVRIQAAGIDKHKKLQVWHLVENDAVEVIENFQVHGDTISFEADRFSVYLVVEITKEQILTAEDGQRYKVTVTYDDDAGIPEDAQLQVSELTEGSEYNKYVKKAAKKLGTKADELTFAHAFDISLVNPETGEHYQPAKPVAVNIQLLTESVKEDSSVNVVHFGDKTEVLDSRISGDSVEFETDGFSVYVVVDHEGDKAKEARVEFHFIAGTTNQPVTEDGIAWYTSGPYTFRNKAVDDNAGKKQASMIVRDGDTLESIEAPGSVGESDFFGWYAVNRKSDSTQYNASTHQYSGNIVYSWPDDADRVELDRTIQVEAERNDDGDITSITWTVDGVTQTISAAAQFADGSAKIDEDGCAHVYLAPIYSNYHFVNFHLAPYGNPESAYIMTRKLIVLGNSNQTDIRVGDLNSNFEDPTYWRFIGWQYYKGAGDPATDTANWEKIETINDDDSEKDNRAGKTGTYLTATAQDYDLYPIFVEIRWVTFNRGAAHNGSSYLAPKYVRTSDSGEGTYPVDGFYGKDKARRVGYEFKGWYLNACMGNGNDFLNQNVGDEGYNYIVTIKGQTVTTHYGKPIQLTDENGSFVSDVRGKDFYALNDNNNDVKMVNTGAALQSGAKKLFSIDASGKFYLYTGIKNRLPVYAKWEVPDTQVDYKVVIWMQKATDSADAIGYEGYNTWLTAYKADHPEAKDEAIETEWKKVKKNYDFYEYHTRQARGNTTVSPDSNDLGKVTSTKTVTYNGVSQKEKDIFTGFELGYYDQNVKVDPQGGTVLNVYYDRKTVTLRFQIYDYIYTETNSTSNNQDYYGLVDGQYVRVQHSQSGWWYANYYTWVQYTGTRYTRSSSKSWQNYQVMTGLYKQTLEQAGYTWPSEHWWYDRQNYDNYYGYGYGSRTTFLDAFYLADGSTSKIFYAHDDSGSNHIYFYKEDLDGSYTLAQDMSVGSGGTFSITDKFDGFTASEYSKDGTTWTTLTGKDSEGVYAAVSNYINLHIRFKRNKYSVTFMPNYDSTIDRTGLTSETSVNFTSGMNGSAKKTFVVQDVPYGQPLKDVPAIAEILNLQGKTVAAGNKYPLIPDEYKFESWCVDASGTVPFNFDGTKDANGTVTVEPETMPAGNLVVYAGWSMVKYRIIIDPNGGVIDHIDHDVYNSALSDTGLNSTGGYNDAFATYFNNTATEYINTDLGISNPMVQIDNAEAARLKAEYEEAGGTSDFPVYRYVNMQFDKAETLEGGKYASYAADARNAVYIYDKPEAIEEYYHYYCQVIADKHDGEDIPTQRQWESLFLSEEKYRKLDGESYTFLGWYEVDENTGKVAATPFDFSKPTSKRTKLRALWRLDGGYTLKYTPDYVFKDGGEKITITGSLEEFYDPDPDTTSTLYADGASTQAMAEPTALRYFKSDGIEHPAGELYQFRGWQIVRVETIGNEEQYSVPDEEVGNYYTAGQTIIVRGRYGQDEYAEDGVTVRSIIHLRAVYEKRDDAYRRPEIINLTLDAGEDAKNAGFGYVNITEDALLPQWGYPGHQYVNTADHLHTNGSPTQILFGDTQSNTAVHLYRYATEPGAVKAGGKNFFTHPVGYKLIGFDLGEKDTDFVPEYAADSVIAVSPKSAHTLYAVWEPMVYLTLCNDISDKISKTDGTLTLTIAGEDGVDQPLYLVTEKDGAYSRKRIDPGDEIILKPGEQKGLVMPYGAGKNVTVHATNTLPSGFILHGDSRLGKSIDSSVTVRQKAKRFLSFDLEETLQVHEEGIYVRFTEEEADRTLIFLDNWNGDGTGGGNELEDNYTAQATPSDPMPRRVRPGYQFLGWALTADGDVAYAVDSRITSMDDFFGKEDRKYLYGQWESLAKVQHLYVYKDVPIPGNQSDTFTFTVSLGGTATTKVGKTTYSNNFSGSQTFSLSHGQYLHIHEEQNHLRAGIDGDERNRVKLTIYRCRMNENGEEVHLDAAPTILYGTVRTYPSYDYDDINPTVEVTETAHDRYTTSLNVENHIPYNSVQQVTVNDATRKITWTNPGNSGGWVNYTNTRKTANVTIHKTLKPDALEAKDFAFTATLTNGDSYTLSPARKVIESGGSEVWEIPGVPTGATLTVTEEVDSGKYNTTAVSTTGSAGTYDDANQSYTLTVSQDTDTDITFTNTLKHHDVKILLKDDESQTLSGGSFTLPGAFEGTKMATGGVIWEGELYYSDTPYTFTELTSPDKTYRKLQSTVALTVNDAGVTPTLGAGDTVTVTKDGDVYNITVVNPKLMKVTVKKVIEASSTFFKSGHFGFTATLTDGSGQPVQAPDVIEKEGTDANGQIEFSLGNAEDKTLYVPKRVNLTVTETEDSAFDTKNQTGSTLSAAQTATSQSSRTATLNSVTIDQYILFTNTLKTVQVTVDKTVYGAGGTFHFTAFLRYNGRAVVDYTLCDNGTSSDDIVTGNGTNGTTAGSASFTLSPNNNSSKQVVFRIPAGSELVVKETGVDGSTKYYTTVAGEKMNDQSATGTGNAAEQSVKFTSAQTVEDLKAKFVNRQLFTVSVQKTLHDDLAAAAVPFSFTAQLTDSLSNNEPMSSYTLNDKGTPADTSDDIVTKDGTNGTTAGSASFTLSPANGATEQIDFIVPCGASLTVTEEAGTETIAGTDTEVYNTIPTNSVLTNITADKTVTFENTRRTVGVLVKKNVTAADTSGTFAFTGTLMNGSTPISGCSIVFSTAVGSSAEVTGGQTNGTERFVTTDGSGQFQFNLKNDDATTTEEIVFQIPIGAKLLLQETGMTDGAAGATLALYGTRTSAVPGNNSVTVDDAWNPDTRLYTLNQVPDTNLTVTCTNFPGLRVETYRYQENSYDTPVLQDIGYYPFSENQNHSDAIEISAIRSYMQAQYGGCYNTPPENCKFDTAVYGDIRNVAAIYEDGRYKVTVRNRNGTETQVDATTGKDNAYQVLRQPGAVLKLYYYETDELIPVLARKIWDAPEKQYQANQNITVGIQVDNGSTALYTDSRKSEGSSVVESVNKNTKATIGTAETNWARLLYVKQKNSYTLKETLSEALQVVDNEGVWEDSKAQPVSDNTDWVEVEDTNWEEAWIKLPCQTAHSDYNNVQTIALYFEGIDGIKYRSEVVLNADKAVNFNSTSNTYYFPIRIPKKIPYSTLTLSQSYTHYWLDNVKGYQGKSAETYYGIYTYSTDDVRHMPRFTQKGIHDDENPNHTEGPIIVKQVEFVKNPPDDGKATDIIVKKADVASSSLRVYTQKMFSVTNSFVPDLTVEQYKYTKGHLDSAELVQTKKYRFPNKTATWVPVNTVLSSCGITAPDGYAYDTAVIGSLRRVSALQFPTTFRVNGHANNHYSNNVMPKGGPLKVYYCKSDHLQPLVIQKLWADDVPQSQKDANNPLVFSINNAHAVYATNDSVTDTTQSITTLTANDHYESTVNGTSTTSPDWGRLVYVPRQGSYTLAEDVSAMKVLGGDGTESPGSGTWHPEYNTDQSGQWVTVPESACQTAYVYLYRDTTNVTYFNSVDKITLIYEDYDGVVYETTSSFNPVEIKNKEDTFIEIKLPKNVDLESLHLLPMVTNVTTQPAEDSSGRGIWGVWIGSNKTDYNQVAYFDTTSFRQICGNMYFTSTQPGSYIAQTGGSVKVFAPTKLTITNTFKRSFTVTKTWEDVPAATTSGLTSTVQLYSVSRGTGTTPITVPAYVTAAEASALETALTSEGYSVAAVKQDGVCSLSEANHWTHTFTNLDPTKEYYAVETGVTDSSSQDVSRRYVTTYDYNQSSGTLAITNARAIARVRSDGGAWVYFGTLQDIPTSTVPRPGAFNYANTLTGEVEIETLVETAQRYTMDSGFTFDKPEITKLTLKTTEYDDWNPEVNGSRFTSTIKRGYNGESLFTSSVTEFNLQNITLDGGAVYDVGGTNTGRHADADGGIVHVTSGTLTINEDTTMTKSEAKNGGAVYAEGTANVTMNGGSIHNCHAVIGTDGHSGGGIFHNGSGTLTINEGTISSCTAPNGTGGGIYHNGNGMLTISGGTITGNSVSDTGHGSAVYVDNNASMTMSSGSITGNSVSDSVGAVEVGGTGARLYFSGDPVIYGNKYGRQQKNVVLPAVNDDAVLDVINVNDTLSNAAHIGVYAPDGYNNVEEFFGSYSTAQDSFTSFQNDLRLYLVGKAGENGKLQWQKVICKLTDENDRLLYQNDSGSPAIYAILTNANGGFPAADGTLYTLRRDENGELVLDSSGKPQFEAFPADSKIKLKMLIDYDLSKTNLGNVDQSIAPGTQRAVTFTTAEDSQDATTLTEDDSFIFTTGRTEDTKRAHITRGTGNTKSMFKVNANADLTTENIVLDGGAKFNDSGELQSGGITATEDGGIVNNSGELTISAGTTMCNTVVGTGKTGGAVYSSGKISITGETDNHVTITNCQAPTAGAIYTSQTEELNVAYADFSYCKATATKGAIGFTKASAVFTGSTFTHCISVDGTDGDSAGAIFAQGENLTLTSCDFEDCTSKSQGGAVYHGKTKTNFYAQNCTFTDCRAGVGRNNSGGALETQATTVEIDGCTFTRCTSSRNAGAINFYREGNEITATVKNSTFTNCKAKTDSTDEGNKGSGFGGALRSYGNNLTTIENCEFSGCEGTWGGAIACFGDVTLKGTTSISDCTGVKGGGVYLFNSATLTIEDETTIQNCEAKKFNNNNGIGGGIYQKAGTMNMSSGSITGNTATTDGGGIYLGGGTMNMSGGSIVSNTATANGGGVYLGGTSTFNFTGGKIGDEDAQEQQEQDDGNGGTTTTTITIEKGNTAVKGGGIYQNSGTLNMTNGSVRNNTVSTSGGGIFQGGGTLNLGTAGSTGASKTASVKGNEASGGNGGGIYLGGGTMNIYADAEVKGNTATPTSGGENGKGGGIYLKTPSSGSNALYLYGEIGGVGTNDGNTAKYGGGLYQESGSLTIGNGVSVTGNKADGGNGGGIYLGGGTLTMNGGSLKANTASADSNDTEEKTGNGGGIYQGGGTLTIGTQGAASGGNIKGNTADEKGGGIYLGGGTFTLNSGEIGGLDSDNEPIVADRNTAKYGGGLFVANGADATHLTTATIQGGLIGGNHAKHLKTEVRDVDGKQKNAVTEAGGGGIAFDGKYVLLKFGGSIQVWGNTIPDPDHPNDDSKTVQCDVCLSHNSNSIIQTTNAGLVHASHIGVYVPDTIVQDTSDPDNNKDMFYDLHGRATMQFGTYNSDKTNGVILGGNSLNRFINNRCGSKYDHYEYYYGVRRANDDTRGIYWADYICEIMGTVTENGTVKQKLLFTNSKRTAPALYQYLGKDGAFDDLKESVKSNPDVKFYYYDEGAGKTKEYQEKEFLVKMLVNEYNLHWSDSVDVPAGGLKITLTIAALDDLNFSDANGTNQGYCTIKRSNCTKSLIKTAAGSDLTIKDIILDGGATYDATEKKWSDGNGLDLDGGLINTQGNLTLKGYTILQHSHIQNGKSGGAICYNGGSGTFKMEAGEHISPTSSGGSTTTTENPIIQECGAQYGAVLGVVDGTVDFERKDSARIENCRATNGLLYVTKTGVLNLKGTFNGNTLDTDTTRNVINCTSSNGGLAYVNNGGTLNVEDSGSISHFSGAANGGAIYVNGGTLNLKGSITDCQATSAGGAVYVNDKMNLTEGTPSITGCSAPKGGAIYVSADGSLTLSNGKFTGNKATIDGACIYLAYTPEVKGENGTTPAKAAKLNLSGAPEFGTDVNGSTTETTDDANTVTKNNFASKKNGDDDAVYTDNKVRQDIFLAETGTDPVSLVVGEMNNTITTASDGTKSGEKDGTIWVWAENAAHYQQLTPFACLADGVAYADDPTGSQLDSAILKVFRNAQPDSVTDNPLDSDPKWLYGSMEGDDPRQVYWHGVPGSRKVILRKVKSTNEPLSGMTFTIYKGTSTTAYQPKGETAPLSNLPSGASGCFWIGNLPYGWYIIEEKNPHEYFFLVVTANGTFGTLVDGDNGNYTTKVGGFASRSEAQTAAKALYDEKK